jgi:hypothetical protein
MLAPTSMLDDDRCSWFVGYVDGDPAACGELLRTADVAGVCGIGVSEQFRRLGLGPRSVGRCSPPAGTWAARSACCRPVPWESRSTTAWASRRSRDTTASLPPADDDRLNRHLL